MATLLLGGLLALGSTSREAWAQHSTGTGAVMVAPGDASAPGRDAPKPIAWRFRTFDMSDYAITGAALTVSLGTAVAPVPSWRWSGSLGVEDVLQPFASASVDLGFAYARPTL